MRSRVPARRAAAAAAEPRPEPTPRPGPLRSTTSRVHVAADATAATSKRCQCLQSWAHELARSPYSHVVIFLGAVINTFMPLFSGPLTALFSVVVVAAPSRRWLAALTNALGAACGMTLLLLTFEETGGASWLREKFPALALPPVPAPAVLPAGQGSAAVFPVGGGGGDGSGGHPSGGHGSGGDGTGDGGGAGPAGGWEGGWMQQAVGDYGVATVLLACTLPVMIQPLALFASAVQLPVAPFAAAVFCGRLVKYSVMAQFAHMFGQKLQPAQAGATGSGGGPT